MAELRDQARAGHLAGAALDVKRSAVVALGGNALAPEGGGGTFEEQLTNAVAMARVVAQLIDAGYGVVLTHGNGPQVGNLALQQEEGSRLVPPQPLFVLGAMTQGQIGHLLGLALRNVGIGGEIQVAALITHVLVDPSDPAFLQPTKPIGPFFERQRATELAAARGWQVIQDAGRGHRRVVPSPEPIAILEAEAIRALVEAGCVTIAVGGGGIPVVRRGEQFVGVDAVIDKDLAAERLASTLHADTLILITHVDHVALDYGTPQQHAVDEMSLQEAETYLKVGQFPPGSMGPKVTAAIRFLRHGGKSAMITSAAYVMQTLEGKHGTRIVSPPRSYQAAAR